MENFRKTILRKIAMTILGNTSLEELLGYLCSKPLLKKHLKLGAIAFDYLSILDRPEARIADLGEYKIWVNIAEYAGISLYFFKQHHEPFTAWLISELVCEDSICIDVGANIGSYTFLMASKVGSKGKVVAFEPSPDLYRMLVSSIRLNQFSDFVLADSRALYSKSGETLKFYLSENPNNSGTSSLINHGVFLNVDNYIDIKTVTLDDYFNESKIERASLVKIDVERAELNVLLGMREILEKKAVDYIVLEQFSDSESQDFLSNFNYHCYLIDENERCIVNSNQVKAGYFGNYIFVSDNYNNYFQEKILKSKKLG